MLLPAPAGPSMAMMSFLEFPSACVFIGEAKRLYTVLAALLEVHGLTLLDDDCTGSTMTFTVWNIVFMLWEGHNRDV